jgi:zinc transport system substrate-binding protein
MKPVAAALLCAAVLTPACVRDAGTAGRLTVVTAVYPMTWVAQRVGGEHVRVVDVAPPGAEPHDIELTPAQAGDVERADLVLLIHGFQPALEDAAPDDVTFDALSVAGGGNDPHLWLDPVTLAGVAKEVATRLGTLDKESADDFRANADALVAELNSLNDDIKVRLASCERHDLLTSHEAFGWFARRYGLRETGIAGIDPEAEPSPRRIADMVAFAKANHVTTVFAETAESKPAQTVAREAGARVAILDPAEIRTTADYPAVMRTNADAVRTALACR